MSNESTITRRAEDLRTRLMAQGIVSVSARYDGYADSGFIDEIECQTADARLVERDQATDDELRDLFYDLLMCRFYGWEDGTGACGEFTWQLASNALNHVHDARDEDDHRTELTGWTALAEPEDRSAVVEDQGGA